MHRQRIIVQSVYETLDAILNRRGVFSFAAGKATIGRSNLETGLRGIFLGVEPSTYLRTSRDKDIIGIRC